jgi:hypothetical protein
MNAENAPLVLPDGEVLTTLRGDNPDPRVSAARPVLPCFQCGTSFVYRGPRPDGSSGRFCGPTCMQAYDAGFERKSDPDPFSVKTWRLIAGDRMPNMPVAMVKTANGFRITCPGCARPFESRGLAYCSPECRTASAERAEIRAVLDALGVPAAVKRQCEGPDCRQTIPRWRNGRQVSSATRFCSAKCQRRAAKRQFA